MAPRTIIKTGFPTGRFSVLAAKKAAKVTAKVKPAAAKRAAAKKPAKKR